MFDIQPFHFTRFFEKKFTNRIFKFVKIRNFEKKILKKICKFVKIENFEKKVSQENL